MASATLHVSDIFPSGTAVNAYLRVDPARQLSLASLGPLATTATVATDGSLTFSGLLDGTYYVASTGAAPYVAFQTDPVGATGGGTTTIVNESPLVLNMITDYQADPTGATDCTTALRNAYADVITRMNATVTQNLPVELHFPPGKYLFRPAVKQGAALFVAPTAGGLKPQKGRLSITGAGRGNTLIQLSSQCPSFVATDSSVAGPGTSYGAFRCAHLTIDGAGYQTGFGEITPVCTFGRGVATNVNDVVFEWTDIQNVPFIVNGTNSGQERRCVGISVACNDPANLYTVTDVWITDNRWGLNGTGGGNYQVLIQSVLNNAPPNMALLAPKTQPAGANSYMDRIFILRNRFDTGIQSIAAVGFGSSGNIDIGDFGGTGTIRVCDNYCRGGLDSGIEIDQGFDLIVAGNVVEETWNYAILITAISGNTQPERSHATIRDNTINYLLPGASGTTNPIGVIQQHGVPFGHLVIENTHVNVRATRNVSPIKIRGGFLSLRMEGVFWSQVNQTPIAANNIQQNIAVSVAANTGRGHIKIDGIYHLVQGQLAATKKNFTPLKLGRVADYTLDIAHIHGRYAQASTQTNNELVVWGVRGIATTGSGDGGAQQETWGGATNTNLTNNYIDLLGNAADIAANATNHNLAVTGNPAHEQGFLWAGIKDTEWSQTGPFTDGGVWLDGTPGATLTGWKLGGKLAIHFTDTLNWDLVEGYLTDDGTGSLLKIDKVICAAGVITRTNLATLTGNGTGFTGGYLNTRISNGVQHWVRFRQQTNTLIAEYITAGAPGTGNYTGTVAASLTYTLTGADASTWGDNGAQGYPGYCWTPADAAATSDDWSLILGCVIRAGSVIRDVRTWSTSQVASWIGLEFLSDSTMLHLTGLTVNQSDWSNMSPLGASAHDISTVTPDATQLQSIVVQPGTRWAKPPAAAAVSPTGSPFTWVNQLGYPVHLYVSGGTVSAITVTKQGQTTASLGTSGGFVLYPGDSITATYTVAPTTFYEVPIL